MVGGGQRFCVQLIRAIQDRGEAAGIEYVSHGRGLDCARELFAAYGIQARLVDIPAPGGTPRPGFSGYRVPAQALEDCDLAWLPWCHEHRMPEEWAAPVVASFHDALMFTEPRIALRYPAVAAEERETVRQWIASRAGVICSSRFSIDVLTREFGCERGRLAMIPISARHARPLAAAAPRADWPWSRSPYVHCPANTSWHKNHEALFEGYARSGIAWPLVLTGYGSDLVNPLRPLRRFLRAVAVAVGLRPPHRAALLRDLASRLGLVKGRSLLLLGNLGDDEYDTVLQGAACVVVPTLGEGGGSFPVEEALLHGVPVVCSDIPVLREQMERLGAEVAWFDPLDPGELAARLRELVREHPAALARAKAQVARLSPRTWDDVAADYGAVFRAAAAAPAMAR